ncbi:TIGR03067 domain-containing protein [Paludisphaera soli]|uniref:TIGR03067 domain-containing protein n=1 Tax=Paludisphaera soli TaxID=2712865 RepID=UPI0013EDD838|nr:TIGR03067 domain-containing protein [Paludisphaera soli]
MMTRILLPALALLIAQAPEASPELKTELARHQGVWRAVSFRRDGKETPEAIVRSITRTVDGDRVVWRRDGKSFSGSTIVLDPAAEPKTIDVRADGGPGRDKVVRGLYKLEGDTLTLCTADPDEPRPTQFKADAGDRHTLQVFDREQADRKP